MSEKQETVHVVVRQYGINATPAKVFDDRKDARAYAKRMNERKSKYNYTVQSCKKG